MKTKSHMLLLEDAASALATIASIERMKDVEATPYGDSPDKERIYLTASRIAYNHVLEMCSEQSVRDWLSEAPLDQRNEDGALEQLEEIAKGLKIIETALQAASSGDLSHAPFPLVGEEARIHLEATRSAYEESLQLRALVDLRGYLGARGEREGQSGEMRRRSVYLLAELSWGDDAYGERLPVAGLFRVTPQTLSGIDQVARMVEEALLSGDGAYVAVPPTDVAWLSRVGFTSENALASVPGFFDADNDHVLYLGDAANLELDGERADFAPVSDIYQIDGQGSGDCALRLQKDPELGLVLSVSGHANGWAMRGYLESWAKLRNGIVAAPKFLESIQRGVELIQEQPGVRFEPRDLTATHPDDYPNQEYDVIAITSDGKVRHSETTFETLAEAEAACRGFAQGASDLDLWTDVPRDKALPLQVPVSVGQSMEDLDAVALVARIEADIALLRKVCIDPMSIKIAESIDIEVRPAGEDDRVLVGRSGWGCTVVNYNAEGLILDVFGHEELEPIHTTSIHACDIDASERVDRKPRPAM